jgi:uncharacterized ubiquitin-like protein YukD
MIVTNKNLFYCYDLDLSEYLRYKKKIPILTVAQTINTKRVYTLFSQSEYLTNSIKEYKTINNHN